MRPDGVGRLRVLRVIYLRLRDILPCFFLADAPLLLDLGLFFACSRFTSFTAFSRVLLWDNLRPVLPCRTEYPLPLFSMNAMSPLHE